MKEIQYKLKSVMNLGKNHPIQGLAAHIVNRAMIALSRLAIKKGYDFKIVAQVHDEITTIVREDQAEAFAKDMREVMLNTTKIETPLDAKPLIGDNWAEAK
jgi:DNA polymerase-1